jgi:hypothetical protein
MIGLRISKVGLKTQASLIELVGSVVGRLLVLELVASVCNLGRTKLQV